MVMGQALNVEFGRAPEPARPAFCALCWRFKMVTSKYCSLHSPRSLQHAEDLSSDGYWFARRLLPLFAVWQQRLVRDDRKLKLRSEWRHAVATGLVGQWVRLRRPRVFELISRVEGSVGNLRALVDALDQVGSESVGERLLRAEFHILLKDDLSVVFSMMSRAEAWLGAQSERRGRWGGARKRALKLYWSNSRGHLDRG
ncbi:hypothetical protein FQZ97_860650 [compost metagenome]